MNLQGRNLSFDMQGGDVRLAQDELRQLEYKIPEPEYQEEKLGDGTHRAILAFQQSTSLEQTGIIDAQTASTMDAEQTRRHLLVSAPEASAEDVVQRLQRIEQAVRKNLNDAGRQQPFWKQWLDPDDPVRLKNLEKVAGHLNGILAAIDAEPDLPNAARWPSRSLDSLLGQLEHPAILSPSNAWELSDLIEIERIRLGDAAYLLALLKAQEKGKPEPINPYIKLLEDHQTPKAETPTDDATLATTLRQIRQELELGQQALVMDYRRGRAMAMLRGAYLGRMALLLVIMLAGACISYLVAIGNLPAGDAVTTIYTMSVLALTLFAGALGSVLSRAIKLGKQPLLAQGNPPSGTPPLGIRALLSDWKVFLAQPAIGVTAAFIVYLVVTSGLMRFGADDSLQPPTYGLIGFLAGFSEPFFLNILAVLENQQVKS